jgi:hypothetical protein
MRITGGTRITGGARLGGTPTGGGYGGGTYTATQSMENSGSNAVHINVSYPWASSVPVGATIVADGLGTFTVVGILTPTEQGNTSGNWFFTVAPGTTYFPGGIGLTFTW